MQLNLIESIGDFNPQLLREFKGRLKLPNVLITVVVSLVWQFWQFESLYLRLSVKICGTNSTYYKADQCLEESAGNWIIKWSHLWKELFVSLSMMSILILLVGGTFLLISDLCQEERRGTLNFIRLSPQSEKSIILGKMLGVPVLLYLLVIVALPFHWWAALAAGIPVGKILFVYTIIVASCMLFYPAALLCSLIVAGRSRLMSWLGWLMPWLGSSVVLAFLFVMIEPPWVCIDYPLAWLRLFSPFDPIIYLFQDNYYEYYDNCHWFGSGWQWYYLPVGASDLSFVGFVVLNYGLLSYWIGQGLKRCFRNPNATIVSKQQSYLLVACLEILILGCFGQEEPQYPFHNWASNQLHYLAFFNAVLLFGLIAILSPSRQILQDWERSRREQFPNSRGFPNSILVQDLVLGHNSPAVLAMAINIAIAIIPLVIWSLFGPFDYQHKIQALLNVALFVSLMMISATTAQLMLMLKTQKRALWATGTVVAAVLLTQVILAMLGFQFDYNPLLGPFSIFPSANIEHTAMTTVFMAILGKWIVLALLNLQLTRQLRRAGESASQCSQ
ncbi:MAG: ABC transporter permease [Symploca sp. SIO1C4]|uniref:ABC transporter permease n=1 Tax=Symploca sp. SIO1C4 TaxID=2607765 RepID=A0A6B3NEI6_9CYAN|nr:ABC transporter permease [Symploca sp. SIO1C4]